MKTLKEELQEIVAMQKLSNEIFICRNLSWDNREVIESYKEMASNYAKKYYSGDYAWWRIPNEKKKDNFIIKEKYRFIKDLIAIL